MQHSFINNGCEETKIIGIFSTEEKANSVVEEYRNIAGFSEYADYFYIDAYE
uniref:DUF7336 domain-containing protein n=1 Tax=Paenibacillus sp. KS-LC4 TaxID=2979727 RepID=UPI00403FA82B